MVARQIYTQIHTNGRFYLMFHKPIPAITYFTVQRRKADEPSQLRWQWLPSVCAAMKSATGELAFPFSLMKWLLKWKEVLIGWFSLGAFWKALSINYSPSETLWGSGVSHFQHDVCLSHARRLSVILFCLFYCMSVWCTHRYSQKRETWKHVYCF